MDEAIRYLLGGGVPVGLIVLVIVLFFPEKVQIWSSLLWRWLSNLGSLVRGAHKRYVKLDLQGRLNEFSIGVVKEAPFIEAARVEVQWAEGNVERRSFLQEGKVLLRLRRDDPEEDNFVHGAYLFVAASLLHKVKRYIAPSLCESVDLYVTHRVLEQEKPAVAGRFLDEYLHPKTKDSESKVSSYFDSFAKIDEGGLFYSVFLQELDILGSKVFGKRKDDQIQTDIGDLILFLETQALRKIGEDIDMEFERDYCRVGILIIGKSFKVTPGGEVYVRYLRQHIIPRKIETLYVLGKPENRDVVEAVCNQVSDFYEVYRRRRFTAVLHHPEAGKFSATQYLAILRMRGAPMYQPSD